jgi:prepilin peptidase CpaA
MKSACATCFPVIAISTALLLAFFGLLLTAAIKDMRTMTIPNGISIALVVLYPGYVAATGVDWMGGMIAGLSVLSVGIALFALNCLGGGDVKLLASTSLWAGTELLVQMLFITALAGGVLCLAAWIRIGGPKRICQRLSGNNRNGAENGAPSGGEATVVPYGVAILAGGAFVALAQLMPIYRFAETVP